MPEPRWWPAFCEAVGRPAWISDERFADFSGRKAHMSELTDGMDALFAERTLAGWGRLFDANDFIWGPASTVAEFASDPRPRRWACFRPSTIPPDRSAGSGRRSPSPAPTSVPVGRHPRSANTLPRYWRSWAYRRSNCGL